MDTLLLDLRYALRSLRRTPGFTFAVVAVMALGIGVNGSSYTVLRGLLLRISVRRVRAHRQDRGAEPAPARQPFEMSMPDLRDVMAHAKTLRGAFGLTEWSPIVSTGEESQKRSGALVTSGLPEALGTRPRLGRWFTPAECVEGASLVPVVLGTGRGTSSSRPIPACSARRCA